VDSTGEIGRHERIGASRNASRVPGASRYRRAIQARGARLMLRIYLTKARRAGARGACGDHRGRRRHHRGLPVREHRGGHAARRGRRGRHRYTLEVSSPGLDRPLRGPADYRLSRAASPGSPRRAGRRTDPRARPAAGMDGDDVLVEVGIRPVSGIPVPRISRARLEVSSEHGRQQAIRFSRRSRALAQERGIDPQVVIAASRTPCSRRAEGYSGRREPQGSLQPETGQRRPGGRADRGRNRSRPGDRDLAGRSAETYTEAYGRKVGGE